MQLAETTAIEDVKLAKQDYNSQGAMKLIMNVFLCRNKNTLQYKKTEFFLRPFENYNKFRLICCFYDSSKLIGFERCAADKTAVNVDLGKKLCGIAVVH